ETGLGETKRVEVLLASRSDTSAARAAVGTVAPNRVVAKCLNNAACAYQHTVTSVVDNLALADLNPGTPATGITSSDAIAAIGGNHAVPYSDRRNASSGIGKHTVGGVV